MASNFDYLIWGKRSEPKTALNQMKTKSLSFLSIIIFCDPVRKQKCDCNYVMQAYFPNVKWRKLQLKTHFSAI